MELLVDGKWLWSIDDVVVDVCGEALVMELRHGPGYRLAHEDTVFVVLIIGR